jgi:hypothetical protein
MSSPLVTLLREHFDDPQLLKQATLQRLWSDYGEIARYYSPRLAKTMIVKHVAPPAEVHHPRGWHSDIGHQRKVQSYHKEVAFYQSFAAICDEYCYVPQFIALIQNREHGEQQTLVMEDLDSIGFTQVYQSVSELQIQPVLSWLAHFHARFLAVETAALWPIGSYWHLATRQAEYNIMPTGVLKKNAKIIADRLEGAHFRTLIHGDAKLANFCFSTNDDVAAVDFQYVGRGVGFKDVMYFLGSCLSDKLLWEKHDEYVDYYFEVLKNVLLRQSPDSGTFQQIVELEQEWRALIPFAWADFNRFLEGWSAEHVKINNFMQAQTALILTA